MEKMKKSFGMVKVETWCRENYLVESQSFGVGGGGGDNKEPSFELSQRIDIDSKDDETIPIPSNPKPKPKQRQSPSNQPKKMKFAKKFKSSKVGDEIDEIFNLF